MKEKTENVVHSEKKDYTALLSVYTQITSTASGCTDKVEPSPRQQSTVRSDLAVLTDPSYLHYLNCPVILALGYFTNGLLIVELWQTSSAGHPIFHCVLNGLNE